MKKKTSVLRAARNTRYRNIFSRHTSSYVNFDYFCKFGFRIVFISVLLFTPIRFQHFFSLLLFMQSRFLYTRVHREFRFSYETSFQADFAIALPRAKTWNRFSLHFYTARVTWNRELRARQYVRAKGWRRFERSRLSGGSGGGTGTQLENDK